MVLAITLYDGLKVSIRTRIRQTRGPALDFRCDKSIFRTFRELISIGRNGYPAGQLANVIEKNRKVGAPKMVVDFQHHYVPVDLAKKRGLYSAKTTYLQEGGRRATTMHARLFDLELQLKDMSEAGIDVSVLSCLLGWNASLDECRLINDDLAKVQAKYLRKFVGLAQAPVLEGEEALQEIERAIRSLSLKGVTSTSQIKGVSLDSPKLYGLYEKV